MRAAVERAVAGEGAQARARARSFSFSRALPHVVVVSREHGAFGAVRVARAEVRARRREQVRPVVHEAADRVARQAEADGGHLGARRHGREHEAAPAIHRLRPLREVRGADRLGVQVLEAALGGPLADPPEEAPLRVGARDRARAVALGQLGDRGDALVVRLADRDLDVRRRRTHLVEDLLAHVGELDRLGLREVVLHHVEERGLVRVRHARVAQQHDARRLERRRARRARRARLGRRRVREEGREVDDRGDRLGRLGARLLRRRLLAHLEDLWS